MENEYGIYFVNRIFKYLGFIKCKKGDIICRQGDKGEIFFIIFNGTVSVWVED